MKTRLGPIGGVALSLALVWISGGVATSGSSDDKTPQGGTKQDEVIKVRPGSVPAVEILPARPPEPLVAPGPTPDLEILLTSAVQGYYQPCG
jgi:hypothetical protein